MKKDKAVFYAGAFVALMMAVNVTVVLLSLRGPDLFYSRMLEVLKDNYLGLHTLLLGVWVLFVTVYLVMRKRPARRILSTVIILFFLYATGYNLAVFPDLNQSGSFQDSALLAKRADGSLDEALKSSQASYTQNVRDYRMMNSLLKGRILFLPAQNILKHDVFFQSLVNLDKTDVRKHTVTLSREKYDAIRGTERRIIRGFRRSIIRSYFLYEGIEESREIYIFFYNRLCLMVPGPLARSLIQ